MDAFHNNWLCCYPRPIQVTFDNGSEFKSVLTEMSDNLGIKCSPTTSYNPQGNSLIERIHQVMSNMLGAFELEDRELDPDDHWNEFLQACAFAIRRTFHTTLQASSVQLVFGRDMIHHIRFEANWDRIKKNKEKIIATSNKRENINRIKHKYNVGNSIILRKQGLQRKLLAPKEGPYTILHVGTNGTVKIQRGIVHERVNIRRIEPLF
jgi:transposase InsO family protein